MNGIGNVVGMAPAALGGCSRIAWVGHAWKALSGISARDSRTGTSDSRQRIACFFPAWTVESFDLSPTATGSPCRRTGRDGP